MSIFEFAGVIGFAGYILAYAALQIRIFQASSSTYCIFNLLAATLVLVSLVESFNLASALIQISWILISLYGLARIALSSRCSADLR